MVRQAPKLETVDRQLAVHQRRVQLIGGSFALLGAMGAVIVFVTEGEPARPAIIAMLAAAGLCLALLVMSQQRLSSQERQRVGPGMALAVTIVYLPALLYVAFGPPFAMPEQGVFRPVFGFVPFVLLSIVMLLPGDTGLRAAWGVYGLTVAITLTGLLWHGALDFAHRDMFALIFWLVGANVMYLLALQSLPFYAQRAMSAGRREEALRRMEQQWRLVLHSMQAGAWTLDLGRSDAPSWASPRFLELLGWEEGEEGAPSAPLQVIHPEDRAHYAERVTAQLAEGDLFDVRARLRCKDGGYRWFSIRAHVVYDDQRDIREVFGAIDDVHAEVEATQALQRSKEQLEYLAYHDPLTGLRNRRFLLRQFDHELKRARRSGEPVSLLMIDVDHFKPYNDHYGHAAGDEVLDALGRELRNGVRRDTDIAARFGGEEFCVVLADTDASGAMQVAESLRHGIEAIGLPHSKSPFGCITVSIGVTTYHPGEAEFSDTGLMIEEADAALYMLKQYSRNRVRHYRDALNEAALLSTGGGPVDNRSGDHN